MGTGQPRSHLHSRPPADPLTGAPQKQFSAALASALTDRYWRLERRVGARLSSTLRVLGRIAPPCYGRAVSRTGCMFIHHRTWGERPLLPHRRWPGGRAPGRIRLRSRADLARKRDGDDVRVSARSSDSEPQRFLPEDSTGERRRNRRPVETKWRQRVLCETQHKTPAQLGQQAWVKGTPRKIVTRRAMGPGEDTFHRTMIICTAGFVISRSAGAGGSRRVGDPVQATRAGKQ